MQKQSPKRAPFAAPLLLGLLDAGPQHGYALFKIIEADLHGICHIGMNRLYALLDDMEAQGLILGHVHASTSGPARKTYQATPKGRRVFQDWLAEPSPTMREMRVDFPPKLYLAQRLGPEAMIALLGKQQDACQRELERMTVQMRGTRHASHYLPWIYDFRIGQIKASLAWLKKCRLAVEREAAFA
jgi:DNA-binding PadR family transcriptional regulator